jgi:hypothetical protein
MWQKRKMFDYGRHSLKNLQKCWLIKLARNTNPHKILYTCKNHLRNLYAILINLYAWSLVSAGIWTKELIQSVWSDVRVAQSISRLSGSSVFIMLCWVYVESIHAIHQTLSFVHAYRSREGWYRDEENIRTSHIIPLLFI